MIRALYSAASGMAAQQLNVDNIANNLANANTNGFKERRTQFQDLLYQSYVQPGAAAGAQTVVPSGLQVGLGTRPASNEIIFSEGNFQQTDNPLDLTIQGKGFFQVLLANGQLAYTRDGGFQLDRNGNVVNASGKHHHCKRRHGQLHPAWTNRGPDRRPNSIGEFSQPRRTKQSWPKHVSTDRC